ncbi:MAG: hypothetical protein N3F07_03265 [Candidatus Micrarchaeota archaeon]|nr:hypothetical protein [Candidatus Micrarchaeota archaeon]
MYCAQLPEMIGTVQTMAAVSLSIMALFLALFWMIAQFLRKAEYESFVSIESHQLLVSAILLISIFGASEFSCRMAELFAGGDPFDISTSYLNFLSDTVMIKAVIALESTKMFVQFWGSMSFRWGVTVWGISVPGFPSFVLLERVVDFLLILVTPFSASLMVQRIMIETIRGIAIPFVLPAGVVMRIFPPTRDAGAFLIASAISFQIVYPYTYVMHKDIVERQIAQAGLERTFSQQLHDLGHDKLSVFSVIEQGLFDVQTLLFTPLIAMSFLLLQALFLPALSMIITVTFIKGLSKFFSQKLG